MAIHCRLFFAVWASVFVLCCSADGAVGEPRYVSTHFSPGAFALISNRKAAPICVDSNDYWGVLHAAEDLQRDFHRVGGVTPELFRESAQARAGAIIVGTLGKSKLIDQWGREGKLDLARISGKWESFLVQVVGSNLVIAGSDKRGTIYGIYDLSQQMGVSPWYWWTDVPVRHEDALFVVPGVFMQGPPVVKYRGIFLNDEAPDLTGWAKEKFGGYNHAFYTNIFELLLRLRANYLWPAMWDNCFSEDDPLNPQLADAYGIVMGTSHVEPMMRADKEWNRLGHSARDWNFQKDPEILSDFWKEGLQRNKPYENIITIGMRGKIDTPMSPTANIALLEKIVAAQRGIIADVMKTNVESVPQLWCLYKEVQEYYEKGMRVPDDVTLLWSDDNWGDLRRLPTPQESGRAGGAGIYYHFDYVGGPRNYKWLNSTPIPKIWEQMNMAWQYGADRIWIVNVGHLHHVTFPTEFFLTMAWNPAAWPRERVSDFGRLWAEREFGPRHSAEIADAMAKYTKYNGRRKPELLDESTYSLTNYNEAAKARKLFQKDADLSDYFNHTLPYAALGGVMTGDIEERAKLNSFRFIAVNAAQFVVGGFTLPLVAKFSAGHNPQRGWEMTMTIWAVLCLVLFLITFATTRERIQPISQKKTSPKRDFADLLTNVPWRIMLAMTVVHFAILSFRGAALYNYYHHYVDRQAMYDWLQNFGLIAQPGSAEHGGLLETLGYIVHGSRADLATSNVADVFNSIINILGIGITIVVILLSPPLARRFGKRAVSVVGFSLAGLGTLAFYALTPTNVWGMVLLTVFIAVAYAPTIPLIWAIYADVADFSEWKIGHRFTGMVFATIGFGLKSGLALGSASFLVIMKWFFDYNTKMPDLGLAIHGFRICSGLIVGLLFCICAVLLANYPLSKAVTLQMSEELAERRAQANSTEQQAFS